MTLLSKQKIYVDLTKTDFLSFVIARHHRSNGWDKKGALHFILPFHVWPYLFFAACLHLSHPTIRQISSFIKCVNKSWREYESRKMENWSVRNMKLCLCSFVTRSWRWRTSPENKCRGCRLWRIAEREENRTLLISWGVPNPLVCRYFIETRLATAERRYEAKEVVLVSYNDLWSACGLQNFIVQQHCNQSPLSRTTGLCGFQMASTWGMWSMN